VFSSRFNVLMSKLILKNKKNIILIYFQIKNILKNNRYHKHENPYKTKCILQLITFKNNYFSRVVFTFVCTPPLYIFVFRKPHKS
jgi:hypothetical protein